MKTLNDIEVLLDNKITTNQEEIQVCNEQIHLAEQTIQQANESLLRAEENVNVEDYNKAKDSIWSAKHAKELYQKRKQMLSEKPLVTEAEYNQLLNEITQLTNQAQESCKERAYPIMTELKKVADSSSQLTQQANQLLHTLQRKVYKEPKGILKLPNGNTTYSVDKEYKNSDTICQYYRNQIVDSPLAVQDEEAPTSDFKYWL